MYMYRSDFKEIIKQCIKGSINESSIKDTLKKISDIITENYPNTKIWFAQRFGKRWAYIVGAGIDTYDKPEKLIYLDDYAAFLQNFDISEEEKSVFKDLFRLMTIISS